MCDAVLKFVIPFLESLIMANALIFMAKVNVKTLNTSVSILFYVVSGVVPVGTYRGCCSARDGARSSG